MDCLVGHSEHVVGAFQVTNGGMQVHWLNWVAGSEVNDVEALCQLEQVLEVLTVTRVTGAVKFHEVGWACHGSKRHPIATNVKCVIRVA